MGRGSLCPNDEEGAMVEDVVWSLGGRGLVRACVMVAWDHTHERMIRKKGGTIPPAPVQVMLVQ
jgi:hypothetical protein